MKKAKLILLFTLLVISYGCQEESSQINSKPILIDKEKIQVLATHFNSTLTKNAALDFHKMHFREIRNSIVIKDFLSVFGEDDLKIANAVLDHNFFKSVFYGSSPSILRTKEEGILSPSVNQLTEELISNIEVSIADFIPSNDLEADKLSLSNNLFKVVNEFELKITNEATLDTNDRNILLQSAGFQRQTIPTLIDLALSIGSESQGGRVKSWSKFWKVVGVVVVTVVAAAIIGSGIGAILAYAGAVGGTIAAASTAGFWTGAIVGGIVGSINGAHGNCPADGWFSSSVPLVDWQKNCF